EDGIRAFHVTGVQTCALPILCSRIAIIDHGKILADGTLAELLAHLRGGEQLRLPVTPATTAALPELAAFGAVSTAEGHHTVTLETGRASCRETGTSRAGAGEV